MILIPLSDDGMPDAWENQKVKKQEAAREKSIP